LGELPRPLSDVESSPRSIVLRPPFPPPPFFFCRGSNWTALVSNRTLRGFFGKPRLCCVVSPSMQLATLVGPFPYLVFPLLVPLSPTSFAEERPRRPSPRSFCRQGFFRKVWSILSPDFFLHFSKGPTHRAVARKFDWFSDVHELPLVWLVAEKFFRHPSPSCLHVNVG